MRYRGGRGACAFAAAQVPCSKCSCDGAYRLLGFGACLLGAAVCFFVAFLTLPLIALRPAKFALAFRYAEPFYHLVRSASQLCLQPGEFVGDVWVSQ